MFRRRAGSVLLAETPLHRATTSVLIEDDRAATVAGFNIPLRRPGWR
jgi:hypothetical protein